MLVRLKSVFVVSGESKARFGPVTYRNIRNSKLVCDANVRGYSCVIVVK